MVRHRIIVRDAYGIVQADYTLDGNAFAIAYDPPWVTDQDKWFRKITIEVTVVEEKENAE